MGNFAHKRSKCKLCVSNSIEMCSPKCWHFVRSVACKGLSITVFPKTCCPHSDLRCHNWKVCFMNLKWNTLLILQCLSRCTVQTSAYSHAVDRGASCHRECIQVHYKFTTSPSWKAVLIWAPIQWRFNVIEHECWHNVNAFCGKEVNILCALPVSHTQTVLSEVHWSTLLSVNVLPIS